MTIYPKRLWFYYAFLVVYFIFQVIFLIVLRSSNEDSHTNAFKILEIYKELSLKLDKDTQLDDSGLHKILRIKQMRSTTPKDITIISQCSSNHLTSVDNLFKAWKGPISVAIFSETKDVERTLWDISQLIYCNKWREFGLSLVVPIQDTYMRDHRFPYTLLSAADKSISCNSDYVSIEKQRKNYNGSSPYPINLLRNVAKMGSSTDFVLVIDIDMIPSANLRGDFLEFIKFRQSNPKKVVYVVPVFETLAGVPTPLNKAGLKRAVESNQARPFYAVPCESCQKLTRYDEWLKSEYHNGTKILYQVEWKHPWEPFFIAGRDVPNFDERFKQYGMNRVSQICEIYVAGFKFLVLDNLFLVHKGYKRLDDFHETKDIEMDGNRRLYVRFKTEAHQQLTFLGRRETFQKSRGRAEPGINQKLNDEDAMDRPSLPPRRTPVVLPHQRYEVSLDGYGPYTPVPAPKPVGLHDQSTIPPPYRMPPHPLPPLPGATLSEPPPSVNNLHTHSSKFPIEREVVLSTGDKNNKIPILSEYNKRPKSAVAPEGPTKQLAWTDNARQGTSAQENCSTSNADGAPYNSLSSKQMKSIDVEKGTPTKEEKTKITKTYHTIKDMISSRFNKTKEVAEEQKQMNNQAVDKLVSNGSERTYPRAGGEGAKAQGGPPEATRGYETPETVPDLGVVQRVYGSRERLVDGFPPPETQRLNQRDTRVMPPLPVLRGNQHPNFSGASDILSPIMPSSPISPQQQQRRLAQSYEAEMLSHQQMQRKMQNQGPDVPGSYSTARAHLVQTIEGSPQRPGFDPARQFPPKPPQEPIYTTGSYLPPHQRRPPPAATAKPLYRDPRPHLIGEFSQSSPNLIESQERNLAANLESNGVYISKTPNPKFSQNDSYACSQNPIYGTRPPLSVPTTAEINASHPKGDNKGDSETDDDDGGFKKVHGPPRSFDSKPEDKREGSDKEAREVEVHDKKEQEETPVERSASRNEDLLRSQENKVSSATSSDYEKATRRSLGQGSSLGDSGRGSAAYSSGRQDSGRASADHREKPTGKADTSAESSDGVKRDSQGNYPPQKGPRGNDSSEWVEIVESELRQILDPKLHGLGGFGSGRGSTVSESVSSLTPPLPPLSPGGGSSPTPAPRQMRYKHSSLPYGSKPDYDSKATGDERKFCSGKGQRSGGGVAGRSNWGARNGKGADKSRSGGNGSRSSKVPLALFGVETDLASTTTGPLDSVLDSRLSDHSSDEDLSTTIDATDALAIRRQLQGLENMYSEVLKLLGVKKYGGRYQPTDPRSKRRYGSMSSLPSSVSSRPIRDKRRDDRKKVKDIKGINKRFQRLESHVVTLARSVAHLSSEMRTQHLMIQEMENIRSEISSLRSQTNMNARSQSVPRALNSMLVSPGNEKGDPSALTNPARVKKLTKFFGDEPPLLRLFLKKLGYEKYAHVFENERIGMVELPYLTEERLQKMGIPMGPRLRILQEAQISFCRDSVYVV